MANSDISDNALYGYNPNRGLAIAVAAIFAVLLLAHTFLTCRKHFWRCWWAFNLGILTEVIGYALRRASADKPTTDDGLGLFIAQQLCIILSPAILAASLYMTYGRIVRYVNDGLSPIRSTRVTLIFVTLDISSFVIQGAGGSLLSGDNPSKSRVDAGKAILIAGFALQIISLSVFMLGAGIYHRRCLRSGEPKAGWTTVLWAMYSVAVLLIVRTVFRLVEFAQGDIRDSDIQQHEVFFYSLETLPIVISVVIMLVFFPARFIPSSPRARLHPSGADSAAEDGEKP